MAWWSWFRRKAAKKEPDAPAPESAPIVVDDPDEDGEPSRGRQMRWLLKDGVESWNARRAERRFWPDFKGIDFCANAKGSRIWGRPAGLVGNERVVLTGVDFWRANLDGATLGSAAAPGEDPKRLHAGADMRGANLTTASLAHARLQRVNFEGALMIDADLRHAKLNGAVLAGADLTNANLADADLEGANLSWANLSGAIVGADNLRRAKTFGTRFAGCAVPGHELAGLLFGRNLLGTKARLRAVRPRARHDAWSTDGSSS